MLEKVRLQEIKERLFFQIFIYSRKDCWFLIMPTLCFAFIHLSSVILGIFPAQQSRRLLDAMSLGIWGTLPLWIKLDSSCCKKQLYYLFTSSVFFPGELQWDQIQQPPIWPPPSETARWPASQLGMWNEDSRITENRLLFDFLAHNWSAEDFSIAVREWFTFFCWCWVRQALFLCNLFQNSWGFFERHAVKIEGCGVQNVKFQQEKSWEKRRKWCREKSDVWWVISPVCLCCSEPLCPVPFLWRRHPFFPLLMHLPPHTH